MSRFPGFLLLASLLMVPACLPSPGPFVLDAVRGRVVDEDSGSGIEGAHVVEWYRGAGTSDVAPHRYARWTRSDADGYFALPRQIAPSPSMWWLRTYGPSWSFYHPRYGLEHGARVEAPGVLRLDASLARAPQRLANLAPICRGERDDPGARYLRRVACPSPTASTVKRPSR